VIELEWIMLKLVSRTSYLAVLAFLLWQVASPVPFWPRLVSAILIAIICVLVGLRLGADSASAYTKDLQRLNKVLVDQNRELEEANRSLLGKVSHQQESRSVND